MTTPAIALQIAIAAHAGQTRFSGTPYEERQMKLKILTFVVIPVVIFAAIVGGVALMNRSSVSTKQSLINPLIGHWKLLRWNDRKIIKKRYANHYYISKIDSKTSFGIITYIPVSTFEKSNLQFKYKIIVSDNYLFTVELYNKFPQPDVFKDKNTWWPEKILFTAQVLENGNLVFKRNFEYKEDVKDNQLHQLFNLFLVLEETKKGMTKLKTEFIKIDDKETFTYFDNAQELIKGRKIVEAALEEWKVALDGHKFFYVQALKNSYLFNVSEYKFLRCAKPKIDDENMTDLLYRINSTNQNGESRIKTWRFTMRYSLEFDEWRISSFTDLHE